MVEIANDESVDKEIASMNEKVAGYIETLGNPNEKNSIPCCKKLVMPTHERKYANGNGIMAIALQAHRLISQQRHCFEIINCLLENV